MVGFSEYASGCNYVRVLNILESRVSQGSMYTSVKQGSEYCWIMPYDRVLNMPGQRFTVLNNLQFWIC